MLLTLYFLLSLFLSLSLFVYVCVLGLCVRVGVGCAYAMRAESCLFLPLGGFLFLLSLIPQIIQT